MRLSKIKKYSFFIIFVFITKCFIAQNLVVNGDFETLNYCPTAFSQVTACANWYSAPNNAVPPNATEYLNGCNSGTVNVPNNPWGYQLAHSGVGYMALATMAPQIILNYRENIYAKLSTPLMVGATYNVSMYVSHTDNSRNSTNNLGLKFSTVPSFPINNIAHVNTTTVITDNTNWVLVSGCFTADSAYQYIAVGNFFTDANTTTSVTCAGCLYDEHGYFIDDVSVVPNATVSISGYSIICSGQSTVLTASGGNVYSWNTGEATASLTVNPTVTTTYTVTEGVGTCTNQAVATVSVVSVPIISITGDAAICSGENATLIASGASTYTWNTGDLTAGLTVNPTVITTYTVTGGLGTCTSQAVATVSVVPGALVSITGNTVICSGESTTLMVNGAVTYSWSTGETSTNVSYAPNKTTTYTVTGTNGSCTDQIAVTISVTPVPVVSITGNTVVCSGNNTSLTASGASHYLWSNGAITASINFDPTTTTTFSVVGTIGNCTNQQTTTVSVINSLTLLINGNHTICLGHQDTLTASGATTYTWSNGEHTPSIVVNPIATTSYSVVGSMGLCNGQATQTVTIKPTPIAAYTLNPNPANSIEPLVHFFNESVNYTQWVWNFGDGSPEDSVNINPSHYYNTEIGGSYQTSLILSNRDGCKEVTTIVLVIDPEFTFYIPNTFTPNGDGLNDTFKGVGIGILDYQILIFDRWGACIYSTNDIEKGWNGALNNKSEIAQEGVYVWTVNIKDMLHANHNYSGTVSLIK